MDTANYVLLIESHQEFRRRIAGRLRRENVDVLEAVDAKYALSQLFSKGMKRPDAIVLDMGRQELNAFEFLSIIKRHHHLARIPVLTISLDGIPMDPMVSASIVTHLLTPGDEQIVQVIKQILDTTDRA